MSLMKVLKHGKLKDVMGSVFFFFFLLNVMGSVLRTETEATIIIIVCVIS